MKKKMAIVLRTAWKEHFIDSRYSQDNFGKSEKTSWEKEVEAMYWKESVSGLHSVCYVAKLNIEILSVCFVLSQRKNEPRYHTGQSASLGGQEEEGREAELGRDFWEPPEGPSMCK